MNEKKINDVEELQRKVHSDLPKIVGITDVASKSSFQRKALTRRGSKKVDLTDADDYEAAELPTMSSRRKSTTYVLEEKKELLNSEVVREVKPKKSTKKKRVKKSEKIISLLLAFVLCFTAVYCATKVGLWGNENDDSEQQMENVRDLVTEKVVTSDDLENDQLQNLVVHPSSEGERIDYSKLSVVDVDFSKLKKVNSDTVSYIKIDGLDISAPIVQTVDNEFYLNHSYDRTPNSAGWIFGDFRNDWNELNDNTIIYGHNRRNYAMFGSLKLILEEKWRQERDEYLIYVSTDKANMVFQMFSAYTIDTENYYLLNKFENDEEKLDFFNTLASRSQVDFGTSIGREDKIITLSTCHTNTSKTVVHAKLVKMQMKS